jgi:hypothetical protein
VYTITSAAPCGASNAGNRFSNTATSNAGSGTSVGGCPGRVGHNGQCSSVGRNVRSWRWTA